MRACTLTPLRARLVGNALAEDLLAIPKGARQFDCHRIHRQEGRTRLFGRYRRDGRRDDDAPLSVGRRCTAGGRAPEYTGDDDCERPTVVAHRPHRERCWHETLIRRSGRGRRSVRCGRFGALGHVARYVGRPARGQGGNGKGREGSASHGHKTWRGACGFQVERWLRDRPACGGTLCGGASLPSRTGTRSATSTPRRDRCGRLSRIHTLLFEADPPTCPRESCVPNRRHARSEA